MVHFQILFMVATFTGFSWYNFIPFSLMNTKFMASFTLRKVKWVFSW